MKALEDLTCCYDYSVRDSTGGLVQFKYGDDALDPTNIEGSDHPVEFSRNLMHIQSCFPPLDDAPLNKNELFEVYNFQTSHDKFKNIGDGFMKSLESFIEQHVVPMCRIFSDGRGSVY
jgi:DNA-directed RNA polymerase III subunit RPC1